MELNNLTVEALESSGAKTILTCDPHCCRMFDVDYRQDEAFQALGIEVRHHTELLAELDLPLDRRDEQVTFHDPCYLSRGRGVTSQPREALERAGVEVVEMKRHGRDSSCCGAGGAQLYIADDKAESGARVNQMRFAEALETGAPKVATACPYCPIMLSDAAGQAGSDVQIVDVAELVAARLPGAS